MNLDLCFLKIPCDLEVKIAGFHERKKWTKWESEIKHFAEGIRSHYSHIFLYHGTKLPNQDLIWKNGLRLMGPKDLAELVQPLWMKPASEIEEYMKQAFHFSKIAPRRSICALADRRNLLNHHTNSFARGGSEVIRSVSSMMNLPSLDQWTSFVVVLKVPISLLPEEHFLVAVTDHIKHASTPGNDSPACFTFNFYDDISRDCVSDVIEFESFKSLLYVPWK